MQQPQSHFHILLLTAAVFTGCAAPQASTTGAKSSRPTREAGFLDYYSVLRQDPADRGTRFFTDAASDFSRYDSVIVEPVGIWRNAAAAPGTIDEAKLAQLGSYYLGALRRELGRFYRLTNTPGTQTLRLRAALTEVRQSKIRLEARAVSPPARPDPEVILQPFKPATRTFLERAAMEVELTDSATGNPIAAFVTIGAGGQPAANLFEVKAAADSWAQRIARRLSRWKASQSAEPRGFQSILEDP